MGAMAVADVAERSGPWPAPVTGHDGWRAADLQKFPDDGLRYEIIDGMLLVSPAPLKRHQVALGRLYLLLTGACPPEYEVIVAPADWKIDETTVVQPDLMMIPRAGLDDPIGTPLVAVEIASRSTARIDRTVKFERYAEAGARQYWIVDPGSSTRAPTVEVYDLTDRQYALQGRARGDESLTVTGVVQVGVTPSSLISQQ